MGIPTFTLPTIGQPNSTEDVDVLAALTEIKNILNGNIDSANLDTSAFNTWDTGDFKDSAQVASHGRWLLCSTDRDLSQIEIETELSLSSGDAAALATLLGTGTGSVYGSAASGKLRIPGFAGLFALAENGSTHLRKTTGYNGGAETVALTSGESGSGSHTHSSGSLTAADHSHAIGPTAYQVAAGSGAYPRDFNTNNSGTLSVSGSTGSSSGGSGTPHQNMPPFRVKGNVFMRV